MVVYFFSCLLFCRDVLDEREDVQKKTFGKWINSMLSRVSFKKLRFCLRKYMKSINVLICVFIKGNHPPLKDMFSDLRDGTRLLALLEVLTSKQFVSEELQIKTNNYVFTNWEMRLFRKENEEK